MFAAGFNRRVWFFLWLIGSTHSFAVAECSIAGKRSHWAADYCMSKLETDDEIPAMPCIEEEQRRVFKNDCVAKQHYKHKLCELAVFHKVIQGDVQTCLGDKSFMGAVVRNDGVGN